MTAATDGRLEDALELYARAWDAFERVDAPAEQATLLESRAWVFKTTGDTDAAQRDLERALDAHRRAGDRVRELNTVNSLAFTFLAAGDYDGAREVARLGVELGRDLGHRGAEAGCWTTLGEIARFEGAIEDARESYRRAEELDELCHNKHAELVRANAAMLEVGAGNYDEALRRMDAVEPVMVARGDAWMSPFFALARACCHAGKGEWEACDELWEGSVSAIEAAGIIEQDVAWLAKIAAHIAQQAGDGVRERRARELARRQDA